MLGCWCLIGTCLLTTLVGSAQTCTSLNLQWQADFNQHTCGLFPPQSMTMLHDQLGRPYLYVANKEGGLKVFDVTASPALMATIPVSQYGNMEVMNLAQQGNYVYLAIGNHFDTLADQGLAIVDVTNPVTPTVTHFWKNPSGKGGTGAVEVEGNYAYLGAMGKGLIILDISNKNNIQFVSQLIPSINFPPVANPDPKKINARGMAVKNGIVYLCYDAGGIRIINCVNKNNPVETGRWCNPAMYLPFDRPKAYNNLVVDDSLIYAAVDYAGLEVLDISDTSSISLVGWWNPYNAPNANWFGCNVHANEIGFDKNCKHVFLSTGKSDMIVVDVSNPAQPDSCNFYGGTGNGIGTWGIDLWQNQIYLSYICTLGIPFASNWTGVKSLTYAPCTNSVEESSPAFVFVYPIPATGLMQIHSEQKLERLRLMNAFGQLMPVEIQFSGTGAEVKLEQIPSGFYLLEGMVNGTPFVKKITKE